MDTEKRIYITKSEVFPIYAGDKYPRTLCVTLDTYSTLQYYIVWWVWSITGFNTLYDVTTVDTEKRNCVLHWIPIVLDRTVQYVPTAHGWIEGKYTFVVIE